MFLLIYFLGTLVFQNANIFPFAVISDSFKQSTKETSAVHERLCFVNASVSPHSPRTEAAFPRHPPTNAWTLPGLSGDLPTRKKTLD